MSGSTFGHRFKLTTFGESHGPAIGGVIDGLPAGLTLSEQDIQIELDKRKPGSKFTSPRKESDTVKIISGVFEGKSTGAPICILIENTDARSKDYDNIKDLIRPGHCDYTYHKKYKHYDYRGGGRASARETAIRVAAGAIAKKFLKEKAGIQIFAYLEQVGNVKIYQDETNKEEKNEEVKNNKIQQDDCDNHLFCPDKDAITKIEALLEDLIQKGDSTGAKVTAVARNVPVGLGEPVYDKLDADIAKAMMSINAVKAVEIGEGVAAAIKLGSEHKDEISIDGFTSNNSGGILAGISTGQDITTTITLKPTSSTKIASNTVTKDNQATKVSVTGRHDPCVGIRAVPVASAMLALVIIDHYLIRYGNKV